MFVLASASVHVGQKLEGVVVEMKPTTLFGYVIAVVGVAIMSSGHPDYGAVVLLYGILLVLILGTSMVVDLLMEIVRLNSPLILKDSPSEDPDPPPV